MNVLPPVVALEMRNDKCTALVGELQKDGSILITGKGEHLLTGFELGKAPNVSQLKQVLAAAEEQAQVAIFAVHLVMSCDNIQSLVTKGTIPVLTSITDMDVQKNIALIDSIPYRVEEVVFSSYCAALAVTTPAQQAEGVIVIDIGSGMITFVAYVAGKLATIGAYSATRHSDPDIIQCVSKAIAQAGIPKQIGAGILLTGEGAKAQGWPQLVETTFGMQCAVGQPLGFSGLDCVLNRPDYASCLGIIRYAYTDGLSTLTRPWPIVAAIKRVFRL